MRKWTVHFLLVSMRQLHYVNYVYNALIKHIAALCTSYNLHSITLYVSCTCTSVPHYYTAEITVWPSWYVRCYGILS